MRARLLRSALATALVLTTPLAAHAQTENAKPRSGYAMVNGLRMYYEIYGTRSSRPPLLLLHGGGSTIGTNWSRVIPLLKGTHQVIAVEFQAHGHTRDIDRPFTFEGSAEDVAALLTQLHVPKADVFGFSNGGTTALQLAIHHPAMINRLIIASANYKKSGMQEWFWPAMAKGTFADMPQPYKDAYLKINPHDDAGLHAMYQRDAERMLAFTDIPDADVKTIQSPTLVVVADKDVVRVEHALELSRLLPHAQLAVLPGGHGEYLGEIAFPKADERVVRALVGVVEAFLVGE